MKRSLYLLAGFMALCLGAVGAVLPLLPTTPFVLLAALCFGQSSPRLHAWLVGHSHFGPLIENWRLRRAIAPRHKAVAVTAMASTFALSAFMGAPMLALQGAALAGAAGFVLSRPHP